VDWPLVDIDGVAITGKCDRSVGDICDHFNPTYMPYTSSKYREYAAPVWGVNLPNNGGPEGTCDACHQFPLTTSFRDGVMGGAVDSHQWISTDIMWGRTIGSLHAFSYMAEPIPCRTCHYQTVTTKDALTNAQRFIYNSFGDQIAVFGEIPIADHTFHVNGSQDVALDTIDTVRFKSNTGWIQMPVRGTYFPAQNSCGNVSCHGYDVTNLTGKSDIGGQNYVTWGEPSHPWESPTWEGCEFCHRPGGYSGKQYTVLPACNTCHPGMTAFQNLPSSSLQNIFYARHKNVPSLSATHPSGACSNCHAPHLGDSDTDTRPWLIDTIAPDTQVDLHPANPSSSANAVLTFSSADHAATFECSLDGAAFSACDSGQTYSGLSDGSHTFEVRAKDSMGNVDPTPASYSWTVDTNPPDTQISSRPSNPSRNASAAFTFISSDATAVFECSLDGTAFSTCASGQTYSSLSNGSHTFQVRAKDAAGNTDPTSASYTWTVDTIAPETRISSSPANPSYASTAAFTFSSADSAATFECSLDGAAFAPCVSPKTYSGLKQGSHTFQVRAKDAAGNTDATPASFTWTVAIVTVSYTSPAANDGWLLESGEFTNVAGTMSASGSMRLGDDAKNKQYRSILHFNTSSLPNNAIIKKVTLQIKKTGVTGTDPFKTHGNLVADMRKGFFGSNALLNLIDFQVAGAPINNAGRFSSITNGWYQLVLNSTYLKHINVAGPTQFRLRFEKDDDNDKIPDFVTFNAGDSILDQPLLIIEYILP
jgi:hypothetical protein